MQTTRFTSPANVAREGTVRIKHSYEDLTTHICAIKRWAEVTDGPDTGKIISPTTSNRIIADSFDELVDLAKTHGWIRDLNNSRHIYWELIPTSW